MGLRMLRISVPVVMLVMAQIGSCGVFGQLAKLDRQMSHMTPQQQIRADEEFWARVEGRPAPQPAPAPVPQPVAQPAPAPVPQPVAQPAPQAVPVQPDAQPASSSRSAAHRRTNSSASVAGQQSASAFQYTLPEVQDSNAKTGNTLSDWFFDTLRSGRSTVDEMNRWGNSDEQNDGSQREQGTEYERDNASSVGNVSYQSSASWVGEVPFFPQRDEAEYDILVGNRDNLAKGTIRWLIRRLGSVNQRKCKGALTDFLQRHGCFSDLQKAREENKISLPVADIKKLMDEAGNDEETRVKAVYDKLAEMVSVAASLYSDRVSDDVPVIETILD